MAHGAPDHTRLADNAFSHYLLKREDFWWNPVSTQPIWTEVLSEDIVGVFGWVWVGSDNPLLFVRLTIDGVVVFFTYAEWLKTIGLWGVSHPWRKASCTRYDDVVKRYYFIYDEEWSLYIHKNITVEIAYELGEVGNGCCHVFYKERI